MATARVCIIDSYWPAVSLLHHRKELKIIQIWHAVGKIKQSGYQSLGKRSGRSREHANVFHMHENYDYVIAGAPYWNRFYCASFNISEDKLLNYGLPRIDYLLHTEDENRIRFFEEYPELREKRIILYAPTFRKNMESRWLDIIDAVRDEDTVLIIKTHPIVDTTSRKEVENVYYLDDWKTVDLISVCDAFVTDYSAIALEAAVLRKKIYWWIYDYDEYIVNNGLNIDIAEEMGPYAFKDADEMMTAIEEGVYDKGFIDRYVSRYLPSDMGSATEKISDLILKCMG